MLLAGGSSFWHGSETVTGHVNDVRLNDLFGYIVFHEAMKGLKTNNKSVLYELSLEPRFAPIEFTVRAVLKFVPFRSRSGEEVVTDIMHMFINEPVDKWASYLNETDIPPLRLSMCGFISTALSMVFDDATVDATIDILINKFSE